VARRDLRQQPGSARPVTVPAKKMTKMSIKKGQTEYPEKIRRPQNRSECADIPRPCPFVGCIHNLYLDVNEETGSIKYNFPDLEPWDMQESCALDIADEVGDLTLENTGGIINLTRERIRQLEVSAMGKLKQDKTLQELYAEGVDR